jgi:2-iminobutanoate/2-iminopropanoate deaminase
LLVEDWKRRFSLHERSGIQMIRGKSWVFAAGFLLAFVVLLAGSGRSVAQEKRVIKLPGTEALPFSDGVIAGDTLYVAGQEGTDDKGKLAAGGIAAEAQAALANIEKIVKSAGFEMKDIVSVTVYLADIHEFGDMNKVYKSVMPDPKPARATVQVAALVNNARIEISAIAVKQK